MWDIIRLNIFRIQQPGDRNNQENRKGTLKENESKLCNSVGGGVEEWKIILPFDPKFACSHGKKTIRILSITSFKLKIKQTLIF